MELTNAPEAQDQTAPDIHIGHEIKQFMKNSNISPAWLAKRLCCDRTNVYKMLARKSLDSTTLLRICFFLKHDFFMIYSAALRMRLTNDPLLPR